MGVGDYIHSKEAPQIRPATRDAPNPSSRQRLAEQAKVDIPLTTFAAPVSHGVNGRAPSEQQNGPAVTSQPRAPYEDPAQGDMFDTDVDGVDDSTIAATTVQDLEEGQQFQIPPSRQAQHTDADNRPLNHLRPGHRLYGSNWYENLGDKAMKTAGFDSDDADDDASQLNSSLADDEENGSESTDWYYSHKHRPGEEPLSKRLEGFWNASKRNYTKPSNPVHTEPDPTPLVPPAHDTKKPAGQAPPIGGGRKVTLPRGHATASRTRTRFSPPKPSLLEQPDMSSTRHRAPDHRAQPTGKKHTSAAAAVLPPIGMDDVNPFTSDNERRDRNHSPTAFSITDLDVLDNDEEDTIQAPSSKRSSTKTTVSIDPTVPTKRELEADYPPEILFQKSFSDLQAEPFDFTPPAATPVVEPQEPQPNDAEDKVSLLLKLPDQDRANYLSNLSVEEWEECGDQLVDKFTLMLSRVKDLRRARRKTVAAFEAEIKRRHELVQGQTSELSGKLEDMRTGGFEVLRGRGSS